MNCYICGNQTDPRIDHRDNKLRPCSTCETVIHESVEEMERRDRKEGRKKMSYIDDDMIPFDDDEIYIIDEDFDYDETDEDFEIEYTDDYEQQNY
jgi:hypothetical protein